MIKIKIKGSHDCYIYEDGRVWNSWFGRFSTPRNHKTGYLYYNLRIHGKTKTLLAHRLIAEAFIPNPENKPFVNHKDGNKLNNSIDNLEWCTRTENERHAFETKLKKSTPVEKHSIQGEYICTYPTVKQAARENNTNMKSIYACAVYGRQHQAGGFQWKLVNRNAS